MMMFCGGHKELNEDLQEMVGVIYQDYIRKDIIR